MTHPFRWSCAAAACVLSFFLAGALARGQEPSLLWVASASGGPGPADTDDCPRPPAPATDVGTAADRVGNAVFPIASSTMQIKNVNVPWRPLRPREVAALRPEFGDLLDGVILYWGASRLEQIGPLDLNMSGQAVEAQTFGMAVYFMEGEPDELDRGTLKLLAHELVHCEQTARFGGMAGFGARYLEGWVAAGRSYRGNWMEGEAYCRADKMIERIHERYLATDSFGEPIWRVAP